MTKYLLIIFILISGRCFSQTSSFWPIGLYQSLEFKSNRVVKIGNSSSILRYKVGDKLPAPHTSSIGYCNGKKFLYACPNSIWDNMDSLIKNGELYIASTTQLSSIGLLLPQPKKNNIFYYFYTATSPPPNKTGVMFAIIDMNKNGGKGEVILKDTFVGKNQMWGRCLTYAMHQNDTDIWVIFPISETVCHSYKLSSTGLSTNPIASNVYTSIHSIPNYETDLGGMIKATHDSKQLISIGIPTYLSSLGSVLLYDINRSTGEITYNKSLLPHSAVPDKHHAFCMAISPNDSLIYVGVSPMDIYKNVNYYAYLYQLERFKFSYREIHKISCTSKSRAFNLPGTYFCLSGLGLGPDNRIYALYMSDMWRIEKPNIVGKGCQYHFWDTIKGGYANFLINSMPQTFGKVKNAWFKEVNYNYWNNCNDSLILQYNGDNDFNYLIFDWGDGSKDSIIKGNFQNGKIFSHKYQLDGKFNVTLNASVNNCNALFNYSDTFDIKLYPKLNSVNFRIIDSYCRINTIEIKFKAQNTQWIGIGWSNNDSLIYQNKDTIIVKTISNKISKINFTIQSKNYCKINSNIQFTPKSLPHTKLKISTDTLLCKYANGYLQADSLIPSDTIFVKTKEQNLGLGYYKTGSNFSYTNYYGKDTLRFIAKSSAGCEDTMFKPILVKYSPRIKAIFVNDSVQCSKQNSFILRTEPVVIDTNKITFTWSSTKAGNITYLNTEKTWAKLENYPIGKYSIAVSAVSANGCTDVKLKRIQVIQNPKAAFTIPTFCQNQGITIKNQDTLGTLPIKTYSWKLSSASPLLSFNFYLLSPDTNLQTLTHVLTDTFGCSDTIIKTLKANPKPFPNWTLDKNTVCTNNASINITETNAQNTNRQIEWNTSAGINNANNANTFTYTSKGQKNILCIASNSNCSDTQRFTVQVWESPTANAIIPALCKGQIATFFSSSKEGDVVINQYNWKIETQNQSGGNINYTPTKTGALQITHSVSDANNCSDDTIINTIVADTPQVSISAKPYGLSDKFLYEFIANPSTYKTYIWTIQNANYNGANIQAALTSTNAIYTLKVTNEAGCSSHYRDTVDVLGLFAFNVPNVIRPLSQLDTNRGFGFIGANYVKEYHLRIYNRWGSKVFETRNPYQRWIPSNAIKGEYIYKIEARDVYNRYREIKGVFLVAE